MARMLDEEYYNVSRNILDKVGEDSPVDSDALKGLAAYFTLDVLNNWTHTIVTVKRSASNGDDNLWYINGIKYKSMRLKDNKYFLLFSKYRTNI